MYVLVSKAVPIPGLNNVDRYWSRKHRMCWVDDPAKATKWKTLHAAERHLAQVRENYLNGWTMLRSPSERLKQALIDTVDQMFEIRQISRLRE